MKKIISIASVLALVSLFSHPSLSHAANAGDLVKCPDFSAVYYLADDGTRQPFGNEHVFFSWYKDFSEVKLISCSDLADIPLGSSVEYQPGTRLVKVPYVPKVYFVGTDGVLRPIKDEDQAESLFGDDWAKRVDDLPETFFVKYTLGTEIEDGELPEGMVTRKDGKIVHIEKDLSGVEISDILDDLPGDALEDFALNLDEVEARMHVKVRLSQDGTTVERVRLGLRIEGEHHGDHMGMSSDIEELDGSRESAQHAISEAEKEIARAHGDVTANVGNTGIAEAQQRLTLAQDALKAARDAFTAGDFVTAENKADTAKDLAHDIKDQFGDDSTDTTEDTTEDVNDDSGSDSSNDDSSDDSQVDGQDDNSGSGSEDSNDQEDSESDQEQESETEG